MDGVIYVVNDISASAVGSGSLFVTSSTSPLKLPFIMPLEYFSDESFISALPEPNNTDYVIFYSSIVDGQLWCPVRSDLFHFVR